MADWNLYEWIGRSESIYKIVSVVVKIIVWVMLSSFCSSTFAGKEILLVLNLIQASVQLVSSNVKFIWGCSAGGIGLSFLQEERISENKIRNAVKIVFISPFIRISY
jgi:hypothetical protein